MHKAPVALVTGASRGIGAATAIELARRGIHVVVTARTQGGLEDTDDAIRAAGGTATLLPLDLAKPAEIDPLGPSLHARFGRLDILVHAAGTLGKLTPAGHILPKDWDPVMAVNLTAAWRLIATAAPLLAAAPAARAVFLTDLRATNPRAYWGAYGASKAALDNLVLSWAHETEATSLRVNLFDPGPVATRLRAAAFPGEDNALLPTPADVAPAIADLCDPAETRTGARVSPSADRAPNSSTSAATAFP